MAVLMQMIRALPGDEPQVLQMLRDAAAWLQGRGIDQWAVLLKPEFVPVVEHRVANGFTWFARSEEKLVGTISLMREDKPVWGSQGLDGKAVYIHSLAVPREFAGKGIGEAMVRWAIGEARAAKRSVRLDCMAENSKLYSYYEALGFTHVETRTFPNGLSARLYELSHDGQ